VGAQHLPELMRPLKTGALFVIILNGIYYLSGGFEQAFRRLESDGLWRIQRLEELNYMTRLAAGCRESVMILNQGKDSWGF